MLLHFYVEELSAEAALVELIPRILDSCDPPFDYDYDIFSFQGKKDLLHKLPNRLKAYRHRVDDWRVIVLIDRDSQDCHEIKQRLEDISRDAGCVTRTANSRQFQIINRIIIEELEAWFFGDIAAMVAAYSGVDPHLAEQEAYRNPDAIKGGTWEQLEMVLKKHHPGGLEKVRAAEEISRHMNPMQNTSPSFQVFRDALLALCRPPVS
jgi:hypothetical protein